ncbi:M23 family metallopeptidase [Halomicronema sp. CCY15110]|uniref:M23 family metallopeptidase n=1 Tax=Halomicronema sp. CCY15110 TaxID=2767773 RepID=UPI00194F3222|nr:M23 family metallopeptidase [Halomicronema sp. CCY15110]
MSQTTYHYHTHRLDLSSLLPPKKWVLRAAIASTILVPQVNQAIDGVLHPNYGNEQVAFEAIATEAAPFEPLTVYAPYYYDESPAGSYDLTLVDPATDSDYVGVPAPCNGTVIDVGYDPRGYGHFVDLYCEDSHEFFVAHAAEVWVSQGDTLRKGQAFMVQGSTGNSTGPHLHVEITPPDGDRTNRAKTEPIMEQAIAFWEAGVSPVAPMTAAAGPLLSDEEIKKAIGAAEGTVDWHTLEPDADYQGHADPCVIRGTCPGRGTNKGYFSSDQGATPEDANAYQLGQIREAEQILQGKAVEKFGVPLSQAALMNGLDLYNQAPLAALGEGGYIDRLPSADPTAQEIIDARAASFIDPQSGQLDAPGLGGTWTNTVTDQKRRQGAIDHAKSKLDQLREESRDK